MIKKIIKRIIARPVLEIINQDHGGFKHPKYSESKYVSKWIAERNAVRDKKFAESRLRIIKELYEKQSYQAEEL